MMKSMIKSNVDTEQKKYLLNKFERIKKTLGYTFIEKIKVDKPKAPNKETEAKKKAPDASPLKRNKRKVSHMVESSQTLKAKK